MVRVRNWSDQKMEIFIGNLLRAGVAISAAVVLVGAAIYLLHHGAEPVHYRVFHGEPAELRSIGGIVRTSWTFQGRAVIQLGLLLLIATPVVRVAFSIFGFAEENDRMYVGFTVIVLLVLLYSIIGSGFLF